MSKRSKLYSLFAAIVILALVLFRNTPTATKVPTGSPPIRAAIIPHHLTAESLMADLGQKLALQKVSKIIIIGPNHDEVGDLHFSSDPDLLTKDHACFAPKGVLQKYLPDIKINCVLVSSRSSPSEINNQAKKLSKELGESGVLIASVDFSHYQTLQKANENDLFTQKYLEIFDSNSLLSLGNSYLDSPRTIATLFKYLSLNSISKFTIINHTNSALILNDVSLPSTTSYFEYIYY